MPLSNTAFGDHVIAVIVGVVVAVQQDWCGVVAFRLRQAITPVVFVGPVGAVLVRDFGDATAVIEGVGESLLHGRAVFVFNGRHATVQRRSHNGSPYRSGYPPSSHDPRRHNYTSMSSTPAR